MTRHCRRLAPLLLIAVAVPAALWAQERDGTAPRYAGPTERGFLLPNGWTVTPAGTQVALTDLPLNIIPIDDGRSALVATSGYNAHQLSIVDLAGARVTASETVRQSWFGLVHEPGSGKVWWSGGGGAVLHRFALDQGRLRRLSPAEPEPESRRERNAAKKAAGNAPKAKRAAHFQSGLALSHDGRTLYTLDIDGSAIKAIPTGGPEAGETRTASVGVRPYDVALARNGSRLFVSDWAARSLLVLDPSDLRTLARVPVGEHPNQIVLHPHDDRLFVACASSNSVSVYDTAHGVVTETIATGLFPRAPEGSTPDALALAPDGETLYVANADNNAIAVIDVENPGRSQVKGFIPTGWYPTAVAVTPDGKNLLIGVGKGNQTRANPIERPKADADTRADADDPQKIYISRRRPYPYIGTTLSGALSIVPIPDDKALAAYTETVYKNCPYSDALLSNAPAPSKTAIPSRVGDPSPIKHVIYIIKENRTYDQVFGDITRGNGDPSLVMFGARGDTQSPRPGRRVRPAR